MTAAYVFMQSAVKDPRGVIPAVRAIAGVKQAHALAGPIDFVAYVEGENQDAVAESVLAIRELEGVATTDTRFVILD